MKKYMLLEGLRWSRDSGSTLCDTPQNSRSRTGWGGDKTMTYKISGESDISPYFFSGESDISL